jgi:hypothetical protein
LSCLRASASRSVVGVIWSRRDKVYPALGRRSRSCGGNERRSQPFSVRCSPACHGGTPCAASWPLSPLPAHFPYGAGPVAPQQRGN